MPLDSRVVSQTENNDNSQEVISVSLVEGSSDSVVKNTGDRAISLLENTSEILTDEEKYLAESLVSGVFMYLSFQWEDIEKSLDERRKEFQWLNYEACIYKLIEEGNGEFIPNCIKSSQKINYVKIAHKLIIVWQWASVIASISNFTLTENQKYAVLLAAYMSVYPDIPKSTIKMLLSSWEYAGRALEWLPKYSEEYRAKLMQFFDYESKSEQMPMIEVLRGYGKNTEMLAQIEAKWVDMDGWLYHSDKDFFVLGEEASFAEQIKMPLVRIPREMTHVGIRLRNEVKKHPELASFMMSESADQKAAREKKLADFTKNMQNLEARILTAPEDKCSGMQKALEKMRSQAMELANPKQVLFPDALSILMLPFTKNGMKQTLFGILREISEYDTLQISLIERIKKSTGETKFALQNELKEAKRKEGITKDKLFKQCDGVPSAYKNLSDFLEQVNTSYHGIYAGIVPPVFNINTIFQDSQDHIKTDVGQITGVIHSQYDDKLSSHHMEIGVWDRSIHDLFLGNYTDCCIRVDSEYQDDELPIVDYLMDLGMQVVVIKDVTKNIPVYAAWCWIGENMEGETALVIDNVEWNPMYSAGYHGRVKECLIPYLTEYAKKIGVQKLVIGTFNNDIEIENFPKDFTKQLVANEGVKENLYFDQEHLYHKLWGYAHAVSETEEYYLEAQWSTPKCIWKKKKNRR